MPKVSASNIICFLSFIFQGQYRFKCPALIKGTLQRCDKEWPYQEVRRLAVLTAKEMQHFEESIALLSAIEYCEYKTVSVLLLLSLPSQQIQDSFKGNLLP